MTCIELENRPNAQGLLEHKIFSTLKQSLNKTKFDDRYEIFDKKPVKGDLIKVRDLDESKMYTFYFQLFFL